MKRIHSSHRLHMWPMNITHVFRSHAPLSEQEAIEISSTFLTPGIHYIKVESVAQGREFLSTFLTTLNCYHNIAYIGLEPLEENGKYLNLYNTLMDNYLLEGASDSLAEFLYTQVDFDFLWIEATQDLMSAPLFDRVESVLFDLQFDKTVPIVVLSYQ